METDMSGLFSCSRVRKSNDNPERSLMLIGVDLIIHETNIDNLLVVPLGDVLCVWVLWLRHTFMENTVINVYIETFVLNVNTFLNIRD